MRRTRFGGGRALALTLAAATVAAYADAPRLGFVFDDSEYVVANARVARGLTAEGLRWAFTSSHSANWHPLTWISHMADVALFGAGNPAGHHWTSVLIHALNVTLLFGFLRGATGRLWPSAIVAALFGLHPLHVESVAWVSERKDVLSTLLALLALRSYLKFARRPARRGLLPATVLFALALLAKPMPVTLPFVLLLLDFWPLGRWRPRGRRGLRARAAAQSPGVAALVREKAPLFALSGCAAAVALAAQSSGGTIQPLERYPALIRLGNAAVSYVRYLGKALWPVDLAVYYPHPGAALSLGLAAGAAALLVGATLPALGVVRRRPYLAVGWLWYLGTLVPVIGLVQVGAQAMADRYTYLPLVGPFVALVWALAGIGEGSPLVRRTSVLAAGASVALLWALTQRQVGYWRDDLTLWRRAAAAAPHSGFVRFQLTVAHLNRGNALSDSGRYEEAFEHYREALLLDSSGAQAPLIHLNLGVALARRGRRAEAADHYREALRLRPGFPEALANLDALARGAGPH